MDLREVIKRTDVDTVGIQIANLWDSMETYRVDKEAGISSNSRFWLRWRMFRNKGWMQIINQRTLHFPSIPYKNSYRCFKAKTLLIHLGYLNLIDRQHKYDFYQVEDRDRILNYDIILDDNYDVENIHDISFYML